MDITKLIYSKDQAEAKKVIEDWGSLNWLASEKNLGTEGVTVGRVVIKKGKSNPRHAHPNAEEVLYLLTGKLEHTVGSEKVVIEAGDTLLIPAGVFHNAVNNGDCDADMIVSYNTNNRQFVLEEETI